MTDLEFVTTHRRYLHAHPELSMNEFNTTRYIKEVLNSLNIEYTTPLNTGVIVELDGNSDTTIGFRADIDALPIHEENDTEYRSLTDGVMHACGHDGHTAALLLFVKRCHDLKNNGLLKHNCVFIFQPSEETMAGAKQLIDAWDGSMKMDAVFGVHLMPDEDTGLYLYRDDEITASATEYRFYITGQSSHVAQKHKGVSAVEALMYVAREVSQIQQYHLDGLNRNIVHVGQMNAGEAINTVASNAYLEGTIRTYEADDLNTVTRQMDKIRQSAQLLYGVDVALKFNEGYPATKNSPELKAVVDQAVKNINGTSVLNEKPYLFGEDFSFYREIAPSYFIFVGAKDDSKGFNSSLHTARFDFDEHVLMNVADYFEEIVKVY